MDLLLNEDWHLADAACVDRQNVTWTPECAVASGANLAQFTLTISALIFYMKTNTEFDLPLTFAGISPCVWLSVDLPWGFEPREQGDRRGMLAQNRGESQPWQPLIVSQRLMVSCCLCVGVGSRPTTDAEQIMEALFVDIHSMTHIGMWIWTRRVSQVSIKDIKIQLYVWEVSCRCMFRWRSEIGDVCYETRKHFPWGEIQCVS